MDGPVMLSEEQFRRMVEGVEDYAIFTLDADGRVASWNEGAGRIKGYRRDEILGEHISRFYTDEDRRAGKPQRLLREAAERGRVEDESWRVRKDGTRFWADVVITSFRDEAGEVRGFVKVTRDLTERRAAEEALRQSEERFRRMVDAVKEYAIFLLDPGGNVITWNAGAERLKGWTAAEIVGQHFSRFHTPEDRAARHDEQVLRAALRDGQFEEEGWRVRKSGERFWASVTVAPVRDAHGGLLGFTKVTRDLSERRRLEQEEIAHAEAREAVRLRDEFLSIASHELRTPLTVLLLQLESIRHRAEALDERARGKLERALVNGERLVQLVEALLDVSRIATGRLALAPAPLDLAEVARDVVERFAEAAQRAGCDTAVSVEGDVRGTWDRLRLEQLVSNLLANAWKYGPGAPVELRVARRGELALVEVRDHGPGIPDGDLDRIFGRFERAAPARHYGGLGLGLYLARQIADAHGGRISARNADGGGAVFTVELPVAATAASRVSAGAA